MCRRHGVHIVGFPVGGFFAVEFSPVPRSHSFLAQLRTGRHWNEALTQDGIRAEVCRVVRLDARYSVWDFFYPARDISARAVVHVVAAPAGRYSGALARRAAPRDE